ncbi:MAG: substrate-binding domain-containing protein [Oscillospiraceae bacterium]|nr:substrate-binding domain-containing protein [Oscillospiraceae bacterium]
MKLRRFFSLTLSSAMCMSMLIGCASGSDRQETHTNMPQDSETYAFVAKDVQNPYMQKVYEGFDKACGEAGITPVYTGPESATPQKQIEIINRLVEEGEVDGIAVAANDADALQPVLTEAINSGINVISLDSAVNKDSRQLHIQQADPEQIGRNLIRNAYEIIDGEGGIAILSATKQASNQNLWIEWMEKEIEENPDKYKNTPIVKIAYGDDDFTKSASETQGILSNKDVKIIIAPTTMGIQAAASVIEQSGSDVKLTGLGLPSAIYQYIESGICPSMYLWNPIDIGYLAAYTLDALVNNEITGAVGDAFTAGSLGEKSVTADDSGGTEVILGSPFKFDITNIGEWKSVY